MHPRDTGSGISNDERNGPKPRKRKKRAKTSSSKGRSPR